MSAVIAPLGARPFKLYYSASTISVHSLEEFKEDAVARNRVMGPLPKTPENIARCQAIADAANGVTRKSAERALEYMRTHESDRASCFGFVWGTLARIAGTPDLLLPSEERATAAKTVTR